MSTTPPDTQQPPAPGPGQGPEGPRVTWDDVRDLGRIRRVRTHRRVAGVAGGLARHLDIDPLILRVAFVVLTFFGGVGLLLYIACWLLVPEEGSDWAKVALDRRSRAVALGLVGVVALLILVSHSWWGSGFPWRVLLVVGVIAVIVSQWGHREGRRDHTVPAAQPEGGPAEPEGGDPAAPYAAPASGQPGPAYAPPYNPGYAPVAPRPANPRKRGPILFWFTLGLMAVGTGVLAVVDLAGGSVAPSAYPALVLAMCALALLVGSFWGRAGGIILIGLLAAAVTAGATVADRWDPHRQVERPLAAADLQPSYHVDTGELVVDLTRISDPQHLDGRTLDVSAGVGHLDIRVPYGVTVVTDATVSGPGGINDFGQDSGGINTSVGVVHNSGPKAPVLHIDAHLHVGAIDIHNR